MANANELNIPVPRGLFSTQSTALINGYASELTNFFVSESGLELRKGNKAISYEYDYTYIASFVEKNLIIGFTSEAIYSINSKTYVVTKLVDFTLGKMPINFLETNNRLLFFFEGENVHELYLDNDKWEFEKITFKPNTDPQNGGDEQESIDFQDFTHAIKYKSHIFYYKQGQTIVYYTHVAQTYKGVLDWFDFAGVFGAKGNLQSLSLYGFTAGAGVQSHLLVIYDSGDIVLYDGNNPASASGDWKALSIVSLNSNTYGEAVNIASNLFVLTQSGIADLGYVITNNSTVDAFELSTYLQGEQLVYENYSLVAFDKYLMLIGKNQNESYVYSLRTKGWSQIQMPSTIENIVSIAQDIYFIGENGVIYQAFTNNNDEYVSLDEQTQEKKITNVAIEATYISQWNNWGTNNNKKINYAIPYITQTKGDYQIYLTLAKNNRMQFIDKSSLPKKLTTDPTWEMIDDHSWERFGQLAWGMLDINEYRNLRFSRGAIGRTIAINVKVVSNDVNDFYIGEINLMGNILNS